MNLMTGNFTNKRIGNTQMTNHAGNPVYGYGSLGNNESGFGDVYKRQVLHSTGSVLVKWKYALENRKELPGESLRRDSRWDLLNITIVLNH